MTTRDTLNVLRDIRQQLLSVQDTLGELGTRETASLAPANLAEAFSQLGFVIDEVDTALSKLMVAGTVLDTVEFYREFLKGEDVRNIMEGLAET